LTSDTIQRVSLVDNVTERLRTALLTGEIRPGESIRVTALEKQFGVSHIPIREALRRLEAEALVVALPQRTAVAAGVDLDDLAGLYDLRRLIECQVARRAVEQMTERDVERVAQALAALEVAAADLESPEFWDRHKEFHWAILEPGASEWIRRVLGQLWLAAQRYVRLFVNETVDEAMRDHRELAAACQARDAGAVVRLLESHLDRTEGVVRRGFLALRTEPADESQVEAG
jgi:DNA-binding GntR family transcriptional regulator